MTIIKKTKCLFCVPLLKAFATITIIYAILFLSVIENHFDRKIQEFIVESHIKKIINENCRESFISWTIFDQKPFADQYIFDDVIGCLDKEKKDCATSVKHLNKYYQVPHAVDSASYFYLNSFKGNEVRHFSNIEDLAPYKSTYEAIKNSKLKIVDIWLMAVKGHIFINGIKTNVVYVFSLSHTEKSKYFCPANIIEEKLKELYTKATNERY